MVTGFLGPNGAGKTTTMRMILGLDHPTSGTATIDGKRYRELTDPLRTVGALLDAKQAHPNRSARNHLRWIAATNRHRRPTGSTRCSTWSGSPRSRARRRARCRSA